MILHRMYGGGPILVREDLDIYSLDLSSELTNKRFSKQGAVKNNNKNNIFANQKNNIFGSQPAVSALMSPKVNIVSSS
jgi:hypothetical protein